VIHEVVLVDIALDIALAIHGNPVRAVELHLVYEVHLVEK